MIRINGVYLDFNQDIYVVTYSLLNKFSKRGKRYKKIVGIYKDKLSMLGEKHFTVKSTKFGESFKYDDYGITWFDSYKEAKKFILNKDSKNKLVKRTNKFWEVIVE